MAYLLHMWYVLGIISGICMACSCYICSKPLWNMRGMSFVYLLCMLAYGRAFLWHIHLISMVCLWPVYGVPLQYLQIVYLWHVYSVCLWYIYGYFLKFSKAQENSKKMLKTSKKHCKTRALTTSHSQKIIILSATCTDLPPAMLQHHEASQASWTRQEFQVSHGSWQQRGKPLFALRSYTHRTLKTTQLPWGLSTRSVKLVKFAERRERGELRWNLVKFRSWWKSVALNENWRMVEYIEILDNALRATTSWCQVPKSRLCLHSKFYAVCKQGVQPLADWLLDC